MGELDEARRALNEALLRAAASGDERTVAACLDGNADVEAMNEYGQTALLAAADSGHEGVARLLIEHGANVNFRDDCYGMTPLHWAAERGYEALAKLLVDHGADVNAQKADKETPLHLAAAVGSEGVAQLLIGSGADASAKDCMGVKAAQMAVLYGHRSLGEKLHRAEASQQPDVRGPG